MSQNLIEIPTGKYKITSNYKDSLIIPSLEHNIGIMLLKHEENGYRKG